MVKFHEGISLSGTRACRCKIYNQNIQHTRVQKRPRDNIYNEFIQKSQIFMHFVSLSAQYPNDILVSFLSALWLPKFMGFVSLGIDSPKIYGFHFEISLSPTAQQYASFPSLNLKHPKMSLPLYPQYPSAVLVSSPSALRWPKFMGFISLSPMAQQYVSFPSLNFRHPKYVLPPPWIPPQYPSTVLVSSPSALWLPKFIGFVSLSPTAQQYHIMWVSLLSTLNTQNVPPPPPSIPKHCIGFVSLSFDTPKSYGSHFRQPLAQQYASFPSLNLKHPKNVLPPPPSIPKHCIGFISLSFETPNIYGFHFPQPLGPTICEFPFLQP